MIYMDSNLIINNSWRGHEYEESLDIFSKSTKNAVSSKAALQKQDVTLLTANRYVPVSTVCVSQETSCINHHPNSADIDYPVGFASRQEQTLLSSRSEMQVLGCKRM
mmetsp:Transcript_18097/g.30063  ORF Transcript_18097/g.30063 Transcript_18097/m.30063 type:complete len:107 (-) Transcript_18097:477-797(-)